MRTSNNARITLAAGQKSPYTFEFTMKKYLVRPFAFLILVTCAVCIAPTASPAQHVRRLDGNAAAAGRLIVWRIPGLGNDLILSVNIDGRHVSDLTYGKHLDIPLSTGRHTVSVQPYPRISSASGDTVMINVRPGELYNFTAKGSVTQVILKRS
jgi:hypothetical protein